LLVCFEDSGDALPVWGGDFVAWDGRRVMTSSECCGMDSGGN
jgi:hypothetical protein